MEGNESLLSLLTVPLGVPQDIIMGFALLLVYVNDMGEDLEFLKYKGF